MTMDADVCATGRRLLKIAIVLSALMACGTRLAAQQQDVSNEVFQLRAIDVKGIHRYTQPEVVKLSGLSAGRAVRPADLDAAVNRMAASGLFEKVRYRYSTMGHDMTLTIDVAEASWTVPVVLDNFIWMTDEEVVDFVRQDVPSFDGTAPTLAGASDLIARALTKLLKARHLPGRINVTPQFQLATHTLQSYVFAVTDPAPAMCGVHIEGASAIAERDLVATLRSAAGGGYSRYYVSHAAKGTLTDMYHRRGYWRAAFDAPAARVAAASSGCSGADVSLRVTEGERYAWDHAEWRGATLLPTATLDGLLDMKAGDVADASRIDAGLREIANVYGEQGYIGQIAAYVPRLDDAGRRAIFEITVSEGPQFRMGTLKFVGISDADADKLRKKWKLKPGDVYDASYAGKFVREHMMYTKPGANGLQRSARMVSQPDATTHLVNIQVVFD